MRIGSVPGAIDSPSHIHAPLGPATLAAIDPPRYGTPTLVAPRLGQGSFRALVTDAYSYRCAISKERTLPVLQAAHIRPYADGGQHELSNGVLLRSDLHALRSALLDDRAKRQDDHRKSPHLRAIRKW